MNFVQKAFHHIVSLDRIPSNVRHMHGGAWLFVVALCVLLVELTLLFVVWRRFRRAKAGGSPLLHLSIWIERLAAAALFVIPITGTAAVERLCRLALWLHAHPSAQLPPKLFAVPSAMATVVIEGCMMLWLTVALTVATLLPGAPVVVFLRLLRLRMPISRARGTVACREVLPVIALSLGALCVLVGLLELLRPIDDFFRSLSVDLDTRLRVYFAESRLHQESCRAYLLAGTGSLVAAMGLTLYNSVSTRSANLAKRILGSWRATLAASAACLLTAAAALTSARLYANENQHPLPVDAAAERDLGGAIFSVVGPDVNWVCDWITDTECSFNRSYPSIRLVSEEPDLVTTNRYAPTPANMSDAKQPTDEARRWLSGSRELCEAIHETRSCTTVYLFSDGTRPMAHIAAAIETARGAGYRTLWLILPYRIQHNTPIFGRFRTLRASGLRVALAAQTNEVASGVAIRLDQAGSYEQLVRHIASERSAGKEVTLVVGT